MTRRFAESDPNWTQMTQLGGVRTR